MKKSFIKIRVVFNLVIFLFPILIDAQSVVKSIGSPEFYEYGTCILPSNYIDVAGNRHFYIAANRIQGAQSNKPYILTVDELGDVTAGVDWQIELDLQIPHQNMITDLKYGYGNNIVGVMGNYSRANPNAQSFAFDIDAGIWGNPPTPVINWITGSGLSGITTGGTDYLEVNFSSTFNKYITVGRVNSGIPNTNGWVSKIEPLSGLVTLTPGSTTNYSNLGTNENISMVLDGNIGYLAGTFWPSGPGVKRRPHILKVDLTDNSIINSKYYISNLNKSARFWGKQVIEANNNIIPNSEGVELNQLIFMADGFNENDNGSLDEHIYLSRVRKSDLTSTFTSKIKIPGAQFVQGFEIFPLSKAINTTTYTNGYIILGGYGSQFAAPDYWVNNMFIMYVDENFVPQWTKKLSSANAYTYYNRGKNSQMTVIDDHIYFTGEIREVDWFNDKDVNILFVRSTLNANEGDCFTKIDPVYYEAIDTNNFIGSFSEQSFDPQQDMYSEEFIDSPLYSEELCFNLTGARKSKLTTINSINFSNSSIQTYPNPTSGKFTVELSQNSSGSLQIFDGQAQLVKELLFNGDSKLLELDISMEMDGIYFIQVIQGESIFTNKIIKR